MNTKKKKKSEGPMNKRLVMGSFRKAVTYLNYEIIFSLWKL